MVTFSKEYLVKKGLPDSAIVDKMIDTTRWSIVHEIVFEDNNKFYKTTYNVGATENQSESAWEYQTEVTCVEVHLVEKTVKVWEVV